MNKLINPNEEMSSREIAELTGKQHKHVLRDIKKMLVELEEDIPKFQSSYKDSMNRMQTEYLLPQKISDRLLSKYELSTRSKPATEHGALCAIEQVLGIELKRQFKVGKYRIDGYHEETNTAYEIDESPHYVGGKLKKECADRQRLIEVELGCSFVRIRV